MSIDLRKPWTWMAVCAVACAILATGLSYRHRRAQLAAAYCDNGIGAARTYEATAWTPRINDSAPPEPAPDGMIWIPGGQFWMGTDDEHMPDTKPWHRVYVDGYWMDKTEVTNEQFARFVRGTGYITVAERTPRAEDFPGAPPESLVAGSVVFTPPNRAVALNNHL